MIFGKSKPLRSERVWTAFVRGRQMHLVRRDIYANPPNGVSYTDGQGACGQKGTPTTKIGKPLPKCARCAELQDSSSAPTDIPPAA